MYWITRFLPIHSSTPTGQPCGPKLNRLKQFDLGYFSPLVTFKVSHHEEARSEGTFLGVLCGGLHTLCLFNAKCHQQVNGVQAHGNNLTHVIFVIIPQIKHA